MAFQKKIKKELPAWKKDLFSHWNPKPSTADRNEFPREVVEAAKRRSRGICQHCKEARCATTHHVVSRNRSGRGVLTNAYRACGTCHIEIEGSEAKKQEIIALYIQMYGDKFWYDEQDWEEHNKSRSMSKKVEDEKKQRMKHLAPILNLISKSAGRKVIQKEVSFINRMDDRDREIFEKIVKDVIPDEPKIPFGYGNFDD
jgi:hypothetical protein